MVGWAKWPLTVGGLVLLVRGLVDLQTAAGLPAGQVAIVDTAGLHAAVQLLSSDRRR